MTATTPQPFAAMLDWTLLKGSHDFPGPDGGTCINEAAIIAAGFEYRPVRSWSDCPRFCAALRPSAQTSSRKIPESSTPLTHWK